MSTISASHEHSVFQYYTVLFPWNMSATLSEIDTKRVHDYKNTGVSGSTPVIDTNEYQHPALFMLKDHNKVL